MKNYYLRKFKDININKNAGAGTRGTKRNQVSTSSFISRVSVPKKYGKVLQFTANFCKSMHGLELGTSLGFSSSYIAQSNILSLITIEANPQVFGYSQNAFNELNFRKISGINELFDDALPDLLANQKFDFVFIDGDHKKESTIRYFNQILPNLQENSVVILDDIYWSKGMTEAWHEIRQDKRVSLSIDLFRFGIIFFRKEQLKKEHFILWY